MEIIQESFVVRESFFKVKSDAGTMAALLGDPSLTSSQDKLSCQSIGVPLRWQFQTFTQN